MGFLQTITVNLLDEQVPGYWRLSALAEDRTGRSCTCVFSFYRSRAKFLTSPTAILQQRRYTHAGADYDTWIANPDCRAMAYTMISGLPEWAGALPELE